MAAGYDGTIKIDSSIDSKGFNRDVGNMTNALKPLARAATAIFVGIFGAKALTAVAKLSAEFQRLAIAAQAVGQLYGVGADETRQLVAGLVDMGIQTDVANRAFIEFARAGLDTGLLPALARGAQDLTVFAGAGETSSDVMDRLLHGIITLNPIVLRHAGVIVDLDDSYRKMAAAMGVSQNALSAQERQQAALIAVTEKLRGVTGLYELSQQTAAGQMASRTRIVNELKAALGGPFQDALFQLVKGFNTLAKAFTAALAPGGRLHDLFVRIGAVASVLAGIIASLFRWIAALFGIQIQAATDSASAMGGAMGGMADGANEAADAQDGLADSTTKAGKAAKGALASFDQLNVLQQDTGGGAGAGGGGGLGDIPGGLGEIDPSQFTDPLDEIREAAERLRDALIDFFAPAIESWNNLVIATQPLRDTVGNILKWLWEEVLVPFGEWFAQDLLPAGFDLLGAAALALNDVLLALQPLATWLWEEFLQPASEWVGDAIIDGLKWLTERLYDFSDWIGTHQKEVETFAIILGSLALAIGLVSVAIWIATAATAAFGVVMAVITSPITWIILIIAALIAIIILLVRNWDDVKAGALLAWESIQNAWRDAVEWFQETVIDPLTEAWGIFTDWLGEAWGNTWEGIKGWVKNAINGIIALINGMLNAVGTGINAIINALNAVSIKIPTWVPKYGGSTFAISIPKVSVPTIPLLAQGAVIPPNAQFAAILGDQRSGKNLEAPEGLIRQIIREEIGSIKADIEINFEGSLSALVRELHPYISKETVRLGTSLVKGAA